MDADLKYIYEVYRTGSFSKAAENLFVTQPALSKSIKRTEEAIGMPLFDRKTHPLSPTEAGMCYVRAAQKLGLLEKDLEDELSDIKNLETGVIRIGGSNYVNIAILPEVLTSFQAKYPKVEIRLVEESSAQLADLLERNELDLTFNCNPDFLRSFPREEAFEDVLLMAVPWGMKGVEGLFEKAYTLEEIREGEHLTGKKAPVDIQAFRGLPLIALDKGNNLYDRMWAIYQSAGSPPNIRIVLQQMTTALKLAESGYGMTITCDRLVETTGADLQYYRIDTPLSRRVFYLLLPNRAYQPVVVKRFLEHFRETV